GTSVWRLLEDFGAGEHQKVFSTHFSSQADLDRQYASDRRRFQDAMRKVVGGVSRLDMDLASSQAKSVAHRQAIAEAVVSGFMPPDAPLPASIRARFVVWDREIRSH